MERKENENEKNSNYMIYILELPLVRNLYTCKKNYENVSDIKKNKILILVSCRIQLRSLVPSSIRAQVSTQKDRARISTFKNI
jgi:hypothetical protein